MSNVGGVEKAGMGLLTKVLLGSGGGIGCLGVAVIALMLMMVAGASAANSNDPDAFNTPSPAPTSPVVVGEWAAPQIGVVMTSDFGPRDCDGCSKFHEGIDLSGGCGTAIYAAAAGTVTVAGSHWGYGNAVVIDHGGNVETLYGHMPWGGRFVNVGDRVSAGQRIGSEGNTGQSFGCHLHLEVFINGVQVDPAPFFAARGITWPIGF